MDGGDCGNIFFLGLLALQAVDWTRWLPKNWPIAKFQWN